MILWITKINFYFGTSKTFAKDWFPYLFVDYRLTPLLNH